MICPVCNWDTDIKSCNLHEKDFLKQISKPFTPRLQLNKHAKKTPQGGVVESYQLPDSPWQLPHICKTNLNQDQEGLNFK